jgi:glycosyltransferase involved in cell wall biosynthesis
LNRANLKPGKNILMITQAPFPPDIRLEKEIKSLSDAGYHITVVCNQYDKKLNPQFDYCEIRRVKALFNSVKINRIINFPLFINPRYLLKIFIYIIKFRPEFIHAHDLPMMPIAIFFGKLFIMPIVFDMHENYPAAQKFFDKKGLLNFIFKNPVLSGILERICLILSDQIIVVIEESKNRLIKMGVDESKIKIVSNTVDLSRKQLINQVDDEYHFNNLQLAEKKVLLYTGRVSIERGLDTAVLAMEIVKAKVPNVILLIVGDGEFVVTLSNLIRAKELEYFVKLIKWPGEKNLTYLFKSAEICIIPQPHNDFINTTIPHKLFEYMLNKKPILTSDAIPLKRILKETNCGLCFKSNDPEDFANKVYEILNSNIPFGENGYKAVKDFYNWQNDERKLIRLYEDLAVKGE